MEQGKGPAVDTAFAMFQRRRQIKQEMGHSANVSVLDRIKLEKSKMESTAEAMKARTKQVRQPCQQALLVLPGCVSSFFALCVVGLQLASSFAFPFSLLFIPYASQRVWEGKRMEGRGCCLLEG